MIQIWQRVRQSRLSHSETAVCFLPTYALSLAGNNLTNYGRDKSGVIALAAALKDSKITHLKYVCPSSASHALCFLGYGTEPADTYSETAHSNIGSLLAVWPKTIWK